MITSKTLRDQWLIWCLVGGLASFSTACGRPAERKIDQPERSTHRSLSGPLGETLKKILESKYASECEDRQSSLRTEIVDALDERYDAIQAIAK